MKKWLGMISSAVMGVLAFVFLAISNFFTKMSYASGSQSETVSGYELIKESTENAPKGFGLYKAFTIIMIIVAVLLLAWAVVMLLNNLNVLKLKFNLNLVNTILLAVFAVVVLVAFIALIVMGVDTSTSALGMKITAGPAVGAYLNLVLALAACAGGVVALVKKKV